VILPAGQKHAGRGEWRRRLRRLWRVGPRHWTVIVLADRGLYAPWLFRRIVQLGWHPFLRINTDRTCRPAGTRCFRPLRTCVPQSGTHWQGRGTACTRQPWQLDCMLLACWEPGYKDPWLILTDLGHEASDAAWYGMRAWSEQGFKLTQRAGGPGAAHADDRRRAGSAPGAGGSGRHVVGGQRWWGGGRDHPGRDVARCECTMSGVPASAAGHPVAARQYFAPRLVYARGGAAAP